MFAGLLGTPRIFMSEPDGRSGLVNQPENFTDSRLPTRLGEIFGPRVRGCCPRRTPECERHGVTSNMSHRTEVKPRHGFRARIMPCSGGTAPRPAAFDPGSTQGRPKVGSGSDQARIRFDRARPGFDAGVEAPRRRRHHALNRGAGADLCTNGERERPWIRSPIRSGSLRRNFPPGECMGVRHGVFAVLRDRTSL